jgi:hypothetical protein
MEIPENFKGKKLGVVFSTKDTTVPYENQLKLQKFWNAEILYSYDHDHFYTIVRTGLLNRSSIVDFFR